MRNCLRLWAQTGKKMSQSVINDSETFFKCIKVLFTELTTEFELHLTCLDSSNQIFREEYQRVKDIIDVSGHEYAGGNPSLNN